jgi:plastocyanin
MPRSAAAFMLALLASGCDSASMSSTNSSISITNMTFSPVNLQAPPGAVITVVNNDSMAHSVTSEANAGDYSPGAPSGVTAFDTGPFNGTTSFALSTTALDGTVIPFFCSVHTASMATPTGTITVQRVALSGGTN